jgi:2,4-dienoyl-CoA reductase-like NADH-dependent reductase (Old Yellow Enzyme family)
VLLTGGITATNEAEALLRAGDADLIGVGREMLKTPDWSVRALREAE